VNCEHSRRNIEKGAVMKKVAFVKIFVTIALLLTFLIVLPGARADETDQAIKVTFNQAVQIPGRVLPAGTYWFVLPRDVADNRKVFIFNSDRTIVYAIVLTIEAQRSQPTSKAAFTFAAHGSGQPEAILTWFYPSDAMGHEFIYPKQEENELAKKDNQVTVLAGD
jgi:hypothetical protein